MRRALWMAIVFGLYIGWTAALGQAPKKETETTRPSKPTGSGAAGFLVPGAGGRPLPIRKKTPPPPSKPTSRQQPPSKPGGKPLFLVPGLGGAHPLRPKPLPLRITPPPGHRFFYGPLLPRLPGQQPAPIFVPSVVQPTGTDMPPITGLPGLSARSGNPLLYGVNVVWGDSGGTAGWDRDGGAKARRLAQRMKEAGVTNTRIGINWADVEKVRGKYDWSATDRFVRFVAGLGVTLICVFDVVPDWALDQSPETLQLFRDRGVGNLAGVRAPDPKYYDDLGRFAYACALRYKDVIKHWEFWNEPDGMGMPFVVENAEGKPVDIRYGGDPKIYTQLLRIFYENIKRADPNARVAVGGLQVLRTDFLAGIYANGGKPYFDAVALHPYNGENLIAFDWIDRCRELLIQNGDAQKTFWLTEWGWATSESAQGGISELHHARLIRESLAGMRSRPFITQASYHTLNDWRTNESDPHSLVTMGLLHEDLAPKEGYRAFREMAIGVAAAAPGYRRVTLLGGLPGEHEAGVRATPINLLVDASKPGAPLPPLWEGYALGSESGGAEYFESIVPRLQALRARLVRFDPFPDPDAVKIEEASPAASSALQIDWRYADTVITTLTQAGVKPMINFATMPTALSSPVGNTRLPRDPAQWSAFIQSVVRRYNGEQKRGILYWELSSEPNTGAFTLQEWLPFYAAFARAVTAADPGARVGGPATAAFSAEWLRALIDYCAQNNVPLHFLSWHAYGQSPADYARQVVEVRNYLRRYPPLQNVELCVSEWNVSASPSSDHDGLQAAAYALSVVEQLIGVAPVKSLFYAIKDGQNLRDPASRFWGRWGLLTFDNQPKPVYNAFRMLSRLEGARLPVGSEENTIRALASRSRERIGVLVWSQPPLSSSPRPVPDTPIRLRVRGLPWSGPTRGQQWLVDNLHANALSNPASSELERVADFQAPGGDVEIPMVLAPYSATLIELTPSPAPSLSVSLETPRYVVYGGSRFTLLANLRNASGKPQTVTALLKSSDPLLVSAESAQIGPITLRPGETRTLRYHLRAPIGRIEGQRFFRVTAGDGVDSVAVKFASPLTARLVSQRVDLRYPVPPYTGGVRGGSGPKTARISVSLENRSEEPLSVKISAGSLSETRSVRPRSATVVPFDVPVTAGVPGRYEVPLDIRLNDRPIERLTAVVDVPVPCRYATRKPRINGDLAEWSEAFPMALDSEGQVREKRWGGLNDLSAQAFTMWDEQYLYIAVVVTDDTHFQLFPPEYLWRGDSVQFALDTRRDAAPDQLGYDANDYEFGMATGRLRPVLYRFAGGRLAGPVLNAEVAIERVGSRTIYEAAIPWTQLSPLRPRPDTLFGFSLLVNDSDGQERGYMEWAGGIGAEKRPGQFIGMQLIR